MEYIIWFERADGTADWCSMYGLEQLKKYKKNCKENGTKINEIHKKYADGRTVEYEIF